MSVTRIDDERDERLANYRNVPDPELLERRRLFVAEGRLVVRRLLTSRRSTPRSVLVTEPALASLDDVLVTVPELPVYVVPQRIMDSVTGFNVHRGCLALGERPPQTHWAHVARASRRLAILERVGNADNVGGIFRSAAAFGVDAVLLGPSCADPLYRKAIRTSMGAVLSVPFASAEPWPGVLGLLAAEGWMVFAMVTAPAALPLRHAIEEGVPDRVAVVIGHEGEGLTEDALNACPRHVRIPMTDAVDSLNAATAAAIAFYELRGSATTSLDDGTPGHRGTEGLR